ncbi:flavin-containing monooxygenase FMO GS-OX-like 7 [Colletes gigas]|uniref:flavin-containing monooxygenase FMO GS-OX-like 7 n=1 Tax=Colletes gigas TaxID=935657 RepID=UPI001C9B6558|nr:flavin-containing monooxygenase FMO GS-OX-like 7 [Colletes gigas]
MAEPLKKKVCVVGAGAAGLCAANHFARNSNFEVNVYEQTNDIGGTWVYKEATGLDENGLPIHSSMYRDLRTNLPAIIMNFPDYPRMNAVEPCCATHQEVLTYLKNYAEHFGLLKYIQFNTRVETVRLETSSENEEKWIVRIKNLKTKEEEVLAYDALMICNGHYFDPYTPTIPGIETYAGTVLHSHSYRKPEIFSGKTVLILGAASSGVDIGIDLANHASRVYLSHNNERLSGILPSNMIETMGVERIDEDKIFLKDGSSITANVFVFCTGYRYSFPFLNENCGIRVDANHVTPLYKHLINIDHPTMCIVGIPMVVVPFPMFHVQVQYFLALLEKRANLPSRSTMLEDSKLQATKKRHAHKLIDKQWEYNNSLADAGGFDRLPKLYKLGYDAWTSQRKINLLRYKKAKFLIDEDAETVQLVIPE